MTDPIAALHRLASAVADDLNAAALARAASVPAPRTIATQPLAKPKEPPSVVLVRALANLETLVALIRNDPSLARSAATSTLESLEAQYGNTLGRIIAAVGGLPTTNFTRSDALTRLLTTDAGARAELSKVDPNDGELFEVLFELFVSAPRAPGRAPAPTAQRRIFGDDAVHQDTDHMAQLVAERARYLIPSIIPAAAGADEVTQASEDPDHPVEPVRRVEPIHKAKRQK